MFVAVILLFGIAGSVIGSFIALVSLRWPAGRQFVSGRSACGGCAAVLGPAELVPVFSFLHQRGRCRRCESVIPYRYPASEAGAATIAVLSAALLPIQDAAAVAVLGWALLLLAVLDAEHFWLPSAVTVPLGAVGLMVTAWRTPAMFVDHVVGACLGFALLTLVAAAYRRLRGRLGLGGGDARLFAAAGAWLGWADLPLVLGSAAVAGLVVILIVTRGRVNATTRVPLGVFLAAATWIVALARF